MDELIAYVSNIFLNLFGYIIERRWRWGTAIVLSLTTLTVALYIFGAFTET